ncbi:glutathione S-transferase N-terminal domain-containing protein [Rhodoblastus acidophilus]|uniref:Glutathione S-transferase N-terminal domain-containing protein n=1 Tax=Candidatus Rhodoblastus alkanivorans TaxID=2954117 RepID=A0ABS9Z716_9HYPH|nr:glutathione S-transferase N-terminal domain-containing protein [Candidatus Rhodoblastus alkanivorans]MCI4679244.1 glutathione S-transferase N-terminal domain-containing protein [Candidatus Rhodoblastus alkanivorans]MCI4682432.1 glutathione S-transferase N-terminal domain-containing protein [Candidatus Rhodoblastus alkanivorans]MDI4639738.1 glutathione S-transferase N-terminal domain-containing protein [Rhodoblastus acidophilus]
MKLYMTPGSCSTAIHIILEELEEIFEAHIVNLPAGDQFKPDYLAINPKANIPALARPDGTVLTEVPAIAFWLGKARGRGKLWPKDIENETRALELMTFVAGSIHGHGFARFFAPGNFCPDSAFHQSVKAQGRALVEKTFSIVDKALEGRTWVAGDFSVADAVLFYVEFWADKVEIALPANLLRHYRAMLDRPAVSGVLREEGYRPEKLGQRVEM